MYIVKCACVWSLAGTGRRVALPAKRILLTNSRWLEVRCVSYLIRRRPSIKTDCKKVAPNKSFNYDY